MKTSHSPEFPQLAWDALKDALNLISDTENKIFIHMFNVIYNTNLNNIIYDKDRICAHWIILCKKLISYRTYQGKDKKVIVKLKETFENMFS